jgi:hypothetical protein
MWRSRPHAWRVVTCRAATTIILGWHGKSTVGAAHNFGHDRPAVDTGAFTAMIVRWSQQHDRRTGIVETDYAGHS